MEKAQSDKLRRAAEQDEEIRSLFEYYRDHKASYTDLSVRGVVQGVKKQGMRIGQPKVREFLSLLVDAGIGKGVKDESNNIANIKRMSLSTKELGGEVLGYSKHLNKNLKLADRRMTAAADALQNNHGELKVYPFRQASSLSITLTINGKPVIVPLPELEPEELAALIKRLKQAEDKR